MRREIFSEVALQYTKRALLVILVVFPALSLTVKKINSVGFYLLLLIGLAVVFFRQKTEQKQWLLPKYWPLYIAMATMLIAVFINQAITGDYQFNYFEAPLRLACFAVLFQTLLLLNSKEIKIVQWGVVGGVLIALVVIFMETHGGVERPAKIYFLGIIPFSNFAMLLSFIALLSIKWHGQNNKPLIVLKMLTFFAGLCIVFLSQSRGGWLALLLYIFIASRVFFKQDMKMTILIFVLAITVFTCMAIFSKNTNSRIEAVRTDVALYLDGTNLDTSIGSRLQFWKSAILIIKEDAIIGIGADQYKNKMSELASKKIVTTEAATYPHAHNEILFQTIRFGLFGFISILLVLFVPLFYFLKNISHSDDQIRTTSWMGIAFCLGIFTFGLTDVVLVWRETTTFYVFFMAVFFSYIVRRNQELGKVIKPSI